MKNVRNGLRADIEQLKRELGLGPILERALSMDNSEDFLRASTLIARSKRMCYVNGIVSMYGLIEEGVDNLIMEVATTSQQIFKRYGDLPERIQDSHREMSLRAILDEGRVPLRERLDHSASLHILANNYTDAPVQLNKAVFTYSTANYRHAHITELLRRLDVDVSSCATTEKVAEELSNSGLQFRDAETLIRDLVERRNQVAHSYRTTELLDVKVLLAYLKVVSPYLEALFEAASKHLLRQLAHQELIRLGTVGRAWTRTLGLDMTAGYLEPPCHILLIKEKTVHVARVLTLQSNGKDVDGGVEYPGSPTALGLGISDALPRGLKNAEVYGLPDKWAHLSVS
jgi:hypothetical protein